MTSAFEAERDFGSFVRTEADKSRAETERRIAAAERRNTERLRAQAAQREAAEATFDEQVLASLKRLLAGDHIRIDQHFNRIFIQD